jgi:hypothetical protein
VGGGSAPRGVPVCLFPSLDVTIPLISHKTSRRKSVGRVPDREGGREGGEEGGRKGGREGGRGRPVPDYLGGSIGN